MEGEPKNENQDVEAEKESPSTEELEAKTRLMEGELLFQGFLHDAQNIIEKTLQGSSDSGTKEYMEKRQKLLGYLNAIINFRGRVGL